MVQSGTVKRRWGGARIRRAAAFALSGVLLSLWLGAAGAAAQPVELAAPYEYMGWGDPQPPAEVLADSGLHDSDARVHPQQGRRATPTWDGRRPLLGGVDQAAIEQVRAAGGEVDVSFGGWSGKKLGNACNSPQALAAAYQKVIDAYSLSAIDIDIEHNELRSAKVRQRVTAALELLRGADPGLEISITFPSSQSGPEASRPQPDRRRRRRWGWRPTAGRSCRSTSARPWASMAAASIEALEALARELASAYGITEAAAYEHAGISTMNGADRRTPRRRSSEQEFAQILSFAGQKHLARVSFWSVNRDRPCGGGAPKRNAPASSRPRWPSAALLAGYSG